MTPRRIVADWGPIVVVFPCRRCFFIWGGVIFRLCNTRCVSSPSPPPPFLSLPSFQPIYITAHIVPLPFFGSILTACRGILPYPFACPPIYLSPTKDQISRCRRKDHGNGIWKSRGNHKGKAAPSNPAREPRRPEHHSQD